MIKTVVFIVSLTLLTSLALGQTTELLSEICNSFCEDSNFTSDDPASYTVRNIGKDKFVLDVYKKVWDWEKSENITFRQFSTTYKINKAKDTCVCKPHGLKFMYNKDGEVLLETFYKNGVMDGFEVLYHSTGGLASISSFTGGKREGVFRSYFENGIISERGAYNKGAKVGEWWYYSPEGILKVSGSYIADYTLIETSDLGDTLIYKDTSNAIIRKVEYNKGMDSLIELMRVKEISDLVFPLRLYAKDGEWIYYDEEGTIMKREYYNKGELLRIEK